MYRCCYTPYREGVVVLGGSGIAPLALERKAAAERDARVKAMRELHKLPDREPLLDHTTGNSSSSSKYSAGVGAAVTVVVVPETAMRRASQEHARRYTVRCEALSRYGNAYHCTLPKTSNLAALVFTEVHERAVAVQSLVCKVCLLALETTCVLS
eukprot:5247-Heterococcus_DN1.PRE.9